MKSVLFCVLILLGATSLHAQRFVSLEEPAMNAVFAAQGQIVLRCKITNYKPLEPERPKLTVLFDIRNHDDPESSYELQPDPSSGECGIVLPHRFGVQEVFVRIGEKHEASATLYLCEGLTFTVDYNDLLTIQAPAYIPFGFAGPDAAQAKYMLEFERLIHSDINVMREELSAFQYDYKMPGAEKFLRIEQMYAPFVKRAETYIAQNPSPYAQLLRSELQAEWLHNTLYTGKKLPDSLYNQIKQFRPIGMTLNARNFYSSVQVYLSGIYGLKFKTKALADSAWTQTRMEVCNLFIRTNDVSSDIQMIEKDLETTQTPWIRILLQHDLDKLKAANALINSRLSEAVREGADAEIGTFVSALKFDAQLYAAQSQTPDELIDAIRKFYPNTPLILDLWTTWCGPCIADMRASVAVKKELANLGVKIVYLCHDVQSPQDKWEQKIAEIECPGLHIHLPYGLGQQLIEQFELEGYPSYLFIDRAGTIDKRLIKGISRINIPKIQERF